MLGRTTIPHSGVVTEMPSLPARIGAAVCLAASTITAVLSFVKDWPLWAKVVIGVAIGLSALATVFTWRRRDDEPEPSPLQPSTTFDTRGGSLRVGKAESSADRFLNSAKTDVTLGEVVHRPSRGDESSGGK